MQSIFINLKLDSALEQGALKPVSTDTGQRVTGAAFTCTAACLQGAIFTCHVVCLQGAVLICMSRLSRATPVADCDGGIEAMARAQRSRNLMY
jgi:hypothetical protein